MILAYIQDSGELASETIRELWDIAEGQINAIDGRKALTLRDLNKIAQGEQISHSSGITY